MQLSQIHADKIRNQLQSAGYEPTSKKAYIRYTKKRGDAVFLHHSLNVVRSYANTEAAEILKLALGPPNGKWPESQSGSEKLSWFLNGYEGKSTTTID